MGSHSPIYRATAAPSVGTNWNNVANIYDGNTSTYADRNETGTSATHINGFGINLPSYAIVTSIQVTSRLYSANTDGYICVYVLSDLKTSASDYIVYKSVVEGGKLTAQDVPHSYTAEELIAGLNNRDVHNGNLVEFLKNLRVRFVMGDAGKSSLTTGNCRVYDNYVVVNYTIPDYTVTVKANNDNAGEVTGSGTYEKGQSVTISATANEGYVFKKWSDGITSADRTITVSEDVTYVAEFVADAYVTYDSLMNFQKWKDEGVTVTNGVASNITDTGLTLTTNADKTSSRTSSPFFSVEYGKSYKIDIDIEGADWTVYIFFCDADENRIDFKDATHKFSSSGAGVPSRIFTAPDNPSVVQAQIRLDCRGGGGGTASYSNFRIFPAECEYMSSTVGESERVDYGSWSMPTPVREGHIFKGWNTKPDGSGTAYTPSSAFPISDLTLFSQWEKVFSSKIHFGSETAKSVFDTNKTKAKSVWYGNIQIL